MKRDRPQEVEMAVLALLKKGNDNATTGGELATITGYNTRLISSAISNLIILFTMVFLSLALGLVLVMGTI
ncbi:hypothetical protein [Streptococcus thermophilus]|nr:hypothetical protein [Streptococcus thermophilus]TDG60453.1 hypothetical protein C4K59_002176 [Streptococcus thermophilus]